VDDNVKAFARLDGIVSLIDAKYIEMHLDAEKPEGAENEAVEQVAFADRLLLNKIDLVSEADLERIEARLRAINQFAPIQRCTKACVSVDSVLDIRGFDLKRTLEMDPEFLNTDNEHEHDASVTSLSIVHPGELDLDLVQAWMGDLLETRGADIYRMKGVLAIAHSEKKLVYQGVHMIFSGDFDGMWQAGEERQSKLVFIGKYLDGGIKSAFEACLTTPENIEKKRKNLRFPIGTRVKCKVGGGRSGWRAGEVVAHLYRDEFMPPDAVAPYQCKMSDGELIYVPEDKDSLVKKV